MSRKWILLKLVLSAAAIVLWVLASVLAPYISPHPPTVMNVPQRLVFSSPEYLLGTDHFGRDILSRILWGARPTLTIAMGVVIVASIAGTLIGLAAGYFRGWYELAAMRAVDVLMCFPPIILAMVVIALVGGGQATLILVIGLVYSPQFARLIFGATLQQVGQDYVLAARALGAGAWRVMLMHVLRNLAAPIIVQATLTAAFAIRIESGLSFLGLGVSPPTPSWGLMLAESRGYLQHNFGYMLWPALAIASSILAFNSMGDALRDWFDPRSRS